MNSKRHSLKLAEMLLFCLTAAPMLLTAQGSPQLPALILQAAHNQDQSMAIRDRCRYQQKLTVRRYPLPQGGEPPAEGSAAWLGERTTVVSVAPSLTPDAQGRYEVLVRVIADSDNRGKPKFSVNPHAEPGLLVEVLWDEIFFPLQEEKIPFLRFETLPSREPGVARFHFEPKQPTRTIILASGTVSLDTETAAVREIHIDSLENLQTLNKQLSKLTRISADIHYAPFRTLWNLPATATGEGVSRLPHLAGFFRFQFVETGYEPIMPVPDPETDR